MNFLLVTLLVIQFFLSLFLILLVLIQSSKGGGLAGALTGVATDSIFGAGSRNPLRRITAVVGAVFFVICLLVGFLAMQRRHSTDGSQLRPAAPAPAQPGESLPPEPPAGIG